MDDRLDRLVHSVDAIRDTAREGWPVEASVTELRRPREGYF
jgi:hypothetical protein